MERRRYRRRRYTMNWPRFAFNVILPLQFMVGFLVVLGTVGEMELNGMDIAQFWTQCLIGFLLMVSMIFHQDF